MAIIGRIFSVCGRIIRLLVIFICALMDAGLIAVILDKTYPESDRGIETVLGVAFFIIGFLVWRFCGGYNQFQEDRRTAQIARGQTPTHPSLIDVSAARRNARATIRDEHDARWAQFPHPGIPPPYVPWWTSWYGGWPYYRRMTPVQIVASIVSSIIFAIAMGLLLAHGFNQDCTTTFTTSGPLSDSTSHMTTSCKPF
jgi:hypothetical protein